jgi:3-isopropylmalate/(R)-2-methylmalate dehydratase small subunit
MMRAFTRLTGRILALPQENIDTDQIIPGRFLTTTRFEGLGEHLFADWRFDQGGRPREDCPLNEPRAKNCPILVAGRNFGCGSSREHAPHALLDFGFRVVISSEIADIFRNNSQNIGLLPVVLPAAEHARLLEMDGSRITVDLEAQTVEFAGVGDEATRFTFDIDGFARHCLLRGMDRLDFLLANEAAIAKHEETQ